MGKQSQQHKLHHQQGIALITVMLVVALVMIIATSMTQRLQLQVRKSINQQVYQQGIWTNLGGEELVLKVLKQDIEDSPGVVHLEQVWAQGGMTMPVTGGQITATVSDQHGCFDLNALGAENKKPNDRDRPLVERQFTALLKALGIEDYQADLLSGSVRDWIDANDNVDSPYGAEDSNYSARVVPHLAANSPMVTPTELLAIEGSSSQIYQLIRPYICVIPKSKELKVNINTIRTEQAELLVGLFEGKLTLDDARDILENRPDDGFASTEVFLNLAEIAALSPSKDLQEQLDVDSKDFRSVLVFEADNRRVMLESLIQRQKNGDLLVLSRQFGEIE